jgi:hypothetical protein
MQLLEPTPNGSAGFAIPHSPVFGTSMAALSLSSQIGDEPLWRAGNSGGALEGTTDLNAIGLIRCDHWTRSRSYLPNE